MQIGSDSLGDVNLIVLTCFDTNIDSIIVAGAINLDSFLCIDPSNLGLNVLLAPLTVQQNADVLLMTDLIL